MKKIVLLITFLLAVIVSYGQPIGSQQANNITIRNDAPMLHLRGEGANINFYNGDLRLTRTSNVLTLTGGIFKIGTDTAATQAYARTYGGGATYPPAGIPLSTGVAWGASITNNSTNWNTAYTDRLKWDGGSTGLTAATGRTSLGGTTVGQNIFTLTNPSAITFLRMNADNTVTALSAANFSAAIGAVGITDVRDEIADSLNAYRASAENLSDFVPLLTDTYLITYGAGAGLDADSTLFTQNAKCFGRVFIPQDTSQVDTVRQTFISAGDSLKFNVYYGVAQTNTVIDSLFTGPQASGEDQTTFVPDNENKIPPRYDVWIGLSGTQPTGYRPKEWSIQLERIIIRQ